MKHLDNFDARLSAALILKPLCGKMLDPTALDSRSFGLAVDAITSVEKLNARLRGVTFTGMALPTFRRSFVYSFDLDGRFHTAGKGSLAGLSKAARRAILMDGEPVAEVDIQASGPTIFLALLDPDSLPPEGEDPYALPGLHRAAVKAVMVSMLAYGDRRRGWGAQVPQEAREVPFKEVRLAVRNRYRAFRKVADVLPIRLRSVLTWEERLSAVAPYVNGIESGILVDAMGVLGHRHVPALPLHDGLLVKRKDVEVAQEVLGERFEARMGGVRPVVTVAC